MCCLVDCPRPSASSAPPCVRRRHRSKFFQEPVFLLLLPGTEKLLAEAPFLSTPPFFFTSFFDFFACPKLYAFPLVLVNERFLIEQKGWPAPPSSCPSETACLATKDLSPALVLPPPRCAFEVTLVRRSPHFFSPPEIPCLRGTAFSRIFSCCGVNCSMPGLPMRMFSERRNPIHLAPCKCFLVSGWCDPPDRL